MCQGASVRYFFWIWTYARQPKTRSMVRSGFLPKKASNGVFPLIAEVGVVFITRTTKAAACIQQALGSLDSARAEVVPSSILRLARSENPFDCGLLTVVFSCRMPCSLR